MSQEGCGSQGCEFDDYQGDEPRVLMASMSCYCIKDEETGKNMARYWRDQAHIARQDNAELREDQKHLKLITRDVISDFRDYEDFMRLDDIKSRISEKLWAELFRG